MSNNATFYSFRTSGKYYTDSRGILPEKTFSAFEYDARRKIILAANGGKYPGLSSTGSDLIFIIIPDEDCDFGYPLMLQPYTRGMAPHG